MKYGNMPQKPVHTVMTEDGDRPYRVMSLSHKNGTIEYEDADGVRQDKRSVEVIVLGLVRQRTLWSNRLQPGATGESCRSYDAVTGYAVPRKFDFGGAGFEVKEMPGPMDGNKKALPCAECAFRKWSNEGSTRKPPPCTEEWCLPMVLAGKDLPGTGDSGLYVLKLTMSAARTAERFLEEYRDNRRACYLDQVRIGVQRQQKSGKTFSDLEFAADVATTPTHLHPYYSNLLAQVREYMTTVPPEDGRGFRPMSMHSGA